MYIHTYVYEVYIFGSKIQHNVTICVTEEPSHDPQSTL